MPAEIFNYNEKTSGKSSRHLAGKCLTGPSSGDFLRCIPYGSKKFLPSNYILHVKSLLLNIWDKLEKLEEGVYK